MRDLESGHRIAGVQITVTVSPELAALAEAVARDNDMSRAAVVRRALKRDLETRRSAQIEEAA